MNLSVKCQTTSQERQSECQNIRQEERSSGECQIVCQEHQECDSVSKCQEITNTPETASVISRHHVMARTAVLSNSKNGT